MMAEQFNMNVTTVALSGGEDYELLFSVPLHLHDQLDMIECIKIIGHICEASLGMHLTARDGTEIPLTAQGWNAF
jgi:thiamine-monophosphate kinase